MKQGAFVISLDFELMWGVRDKKTIESYGNEIKEVHSIVPQTLSLFKKHGVKSTFATVGLLFAESEEDIISSLPQKKPNYVESKLNPYEDIKKFQTEIKNPYYFCYHLIELIKKDFPEQELATHTYSHYYCLESGQTNEEFEEDLKSAILIAKRKNIDIKSIVFPRNQANQEYLEVCKKHGVTSYRGVEKPWFYSAQANKEETKLKRAFRLLDTYLNISGHNTFTPSVQNGVVDVKSSRFLRPFSKRLSFLEKRKIARIKKSMTYAAKNKQIFHLWWHPHNFGGNKEEMFSQLSDILNHYSKLKEEFGFESLTMSEIATQTFNEKKN